MHNMAEVSPWACMGQAAYGAFMHRIGSAYMVYGRCRDHADE